MGSYSLALNESFEFVEFDFGLDKTDFWGYLQIDANDQNSVDFRDSSDAKIAFIEFRTDRINIEHGSVAVGSLGSSDESPTELWFHYVADSGGGDGVLTLYANRNSITGTRPSPSDTILTGDAGAVRSIVLSNGSSGSTSVWDKVRISDDEIGSNPT